MNSAGLATVAAVDAVGESYPGERLVCRVGQIARSLHDNLRNLGYDKVLEDTAAKIPDARERLAYVADMTRHAAERALTATEIAQPLQDTLARETSGLDERWKSLFENRLSLAEFKELVTATRAFLAVVPAQARATKEQLHEIMMAQDFQDLTGQIINRVNEIAAAVESQLLQLLIENVPPQTRCHPDNGLMNGPVIMANGSVDVVNSQAQLDDVLESLGF